MKKFKLVGVIAGSLLIAGATFLGTSTAIGQVDSVALPTQGQADRPDFPTNANGQSYGSLKYVEVAEDEPDLILVISDQGSEGYVNRTDLEPELKSPAEVEAWLASRTPEDLILPVFTNDGQTQIGTFTLVEPTLKP